MPHTKSKEIYFPELNPRVDVANITYLTHEAIASC